MDISPPTFQRNSFLGLAWTPGGERVELRVDDRVRPHPLASFSEPTTARVLGQTGVVTDTDTEMWDVLIRFGDWVGGFWADDFIVEVH